MAAVEPAVTAAATSASGNRPAPDAPDLAGVEEFTQLLARAVRQCRTYPVANPLCAEAVAACRAALGSRVRRDRILYRVHPRELIVDDTAMGAGTIVERELSQRLHRAHVASLRIDAGASVRDLTRFCLEIGRHADGTGPALTFAEVLTDQGVDRIVPEMARPPEVLEIGVPGPERQGFVQQERERRAALPGAGAVAHLYPPDRGWIRVDPGVSLATVSLSDLALLADTPGDLAAMLLRLTDEGAGGSSPQEALQLKFSDVATLFASLDPRLARLMFARLASAVLALDTERRTDLLQRTILPGLLDGRLDGLVLREFPDVDLAGALCLLLDLETAAPEVLAAALDRLELSEERREAVVPLLDEGLKRRHAEGRAGTGDGAERYARQLIHVEAGRCAAFADFAAFDLQVDEQAQQAMEAVREGIGATDIPASRLECLASLVRLEPNPELVQRFLARSRPLLEQLHGERRLSDLAAQLGALRAIAEDVRETRPDVADIVDGALGQFFTGARILALHELYEADGAGRETAARIVRAAGAGAGGAFVALLESAPAPETARALVHLMCDHAALLAPALASRLPGCGPAAARVVVRVLGHAGAGYEAAIAARLCGGEEQTSREALRALARIGTGEAAALVAARILEGPDAIRGAAEEALWRFPPEESAARVRALLDHREFARGNPDTALRLLDRAARAGVANLGPALSALAPLRFHFWSPARARLGARAHRQLTS